MNLTQGNFYWNKRNNIKYSYEYLKENKICDTLIVGGGIGGAITAYFQAKQGYKVILVEKNIIGYGSTLENPGILSYEEKVFVKNKNITEKQIERCNDLTKKAIDNIYKIVEEINEFNKDNNIHISIEKKDEIFYSEKATNRMQIYREYTKLLEKNMVDYIDTHDILNLKTGIININGSACFDPYLFTQELIHMLATFKNVEIYENTCIEDITNNDEYVQSVTKNRQKILSKKVILTCGYGSMKYLKDTPISLMKNFVIVTEKINNIAKEDREFVAKDIYEPSNFIRFTDSGEIIMGGGTLKVTEKVITDKYINAVIEGRYKRLFNNLVKMLPNEEKIKVKNCYYGMYLETKDNLPIIDEFDNLPNVYLNLGIGTNGIVYSTIGANILKDVCKEYHTKDMAMFKINRTT